MNYLITASGLTGNYFDLGLVIEEGQWIFSETNILIKL